MWEFAIDFKCQWSKWSTSALCACRGPTWRRKAHAEPMNCRCLPYQQYRGPAANKTMNGWLALYQHIIGLLLQVSGCGARVDVSTGQAPCTILTHAQSLVSLPFCGRRCFHNTLLTCSPRATAKLSHPQPVLFLLSQAVLMHFVDSHDLHVCFFVAPLLPPQAVPCAQMWGGDPLFVTRWFRETLL